MKTLLAETLTKNTNNWLGFIRSINEKIDNLLLTSIDFKDVLDAIVNHSNSSIDGLIIKITSNEGQQERFFYEKSNDSSANLTEKFKIEGSEWFECQLSIWIKTGKLKEQFDINKIKDLIKSYWKLGYRDDKTQIVSENYPTTKELINKTVVQFQRNYNYISFFFCDLDKFKQINSNYGQLQGDSVILQMAQFIDSFVTSKPGIVIHRSGDEFIIIFFTNSIENSLRYSFELQSTFKNFNFNINDNGNEITINKSITIGTKIFSTLTDELVSYENEIVDAEKAMKDGGTKEKNYNRANVFNSLINNETVFNLIDENLNLSKIICKTSSSQVPFKNVWLNLISQHTYQILVEGITLAKIEELIEWICVKTGSNCKSCEANDDKVDYSKSFSIFDIFAAVVNGIYHYNITNDITDDYSLKFEKKQLSLIKNNTEVILTYKDSNRTKFKFGSSFKGIATPLAILLKIGHNPTNLPDKIFADKLVIDDRPSRGGGLPDFWEATISKLVSILQMNKNIKKVYVLGDSEYGVKTIEYLKKLSTTTLTSEDFDKMVYKINVSNSALSNAIDMLKNNVEIHETSKGIIDSYCNLITVGKNIQTVEVDKKTDKSVPFLEKDLKIDNFGLTKEDGFKVDTLSQAFPLMLEIARKSAHLNEIKDQAGSKLGELLDFKVVLSNPLKTPIPFYYRNEEENFKKYYEDLFVNEMGLFAKQLNDQKTVVLDHLIEIISNPNLQYSTRRAILIISNEVGNDELAPLGLVSIRLIPRFEINGSVKISYSFSWRTVEALVGFPYSFYGSIQYSNHLTDLIKNAISSKNIELNLGSVTYIAHNLHIFMDDYGQSIAKRISDDSSI
jgi:diguanylate cyclase (GGDEF)-like protein